LRHIDWLQFRARLAPDSLAIVTPRIRLTYRQLARASMAIADRLAAHGLKKGQIAAIGVPNPALHCALITALNALGAPSLSLGLNENDELDATGGVRVDWALAREGARAEGVERVLHLDWHWLETPDAPLSATQHPGFDGPDSLSMLATSSGTTGSPKAMGFSVWHIENRLLRHGYAPFAARQGESMLSMFGLRTTIGFQLAFTTLLAGGTLFMGFNQTAAGRVIEQFRVDRVCGSPAQLAAMMHHLEREPADCSSLKLVFLGGSATPPALAARLARGLSANVMGSYGATETGFIAHAPLSRLSAVPGAAGYLEPWCRGEAVDEHDRPLPAGTLGRLRLKTGQNVPGYINAPEATRAMFRDGWFYPGDIGAVTEDGLLVILGRSDEVLNIGGVKFDPLLVADALLARPEIRDAAVFSAPDERGESTIWAAIVADVALDRQALQAFCRDTLAHRAPTRFLFLPSLPRNENAKLVVSRLREAAAQSLRKP
jgi:acyl-coenzyme A synthetase/AMP-(fatty) acid ligase